MEEYDFGFNWAAPVKEKFMSFVEDLCKHEGLSFLWISQQNVESVLSKLESNKLMVKVLLDTEATYHKPNDVYSRLCYAVKDNGGSVINDPDRARLYIDKSVTHYELLNMGITVPNTVIIRNWESENFQLTDEEKLMLGTPFIIKPALGYAQMGLVRNAQGSREEIARARNFDKGDNFLLQEEINPIRFDDKRAWFRVFNVFHTIIPCWWDDRTNLYEHVSYDEFCKYELYPLVRIISSIAIMSRMVWFSTEIAVDNKNGNLRFVAIDYLNDQCDMSTKEEAPNGVPCDVVKYISSCIVDVAKRCINHESINKKYTVLLDDGIVEVDGLGDAPTFLKQMRFY